MREQLLGYLLGALEPHEHAEVAAKVAADAELRRELELLAKSLEPLADEHHEPPPGLAQKACQYVADRRGPGAGQFGACSQWRLQDLCVASALFAAVMMLVVPAVYQSRTQAHLEYCQRNLATLGQALVQFSQIHNNEFPQVPVQGNLAAAGIYAPLLREAGLIVDSNVVCPASQMRKCSEFRIPTRDELLAARGGLLQRLQSTMGGSYGYCIGYVQNGRYHVRCNRGRENFALVADVPLQWVNEPTSHHGRGQNVMFEDGHVRYVSTAKLSDGDDHFFMNGLGYVAAGIGADDAVIAPSGTQPVILRTMLEDE